MRGGEEVEILNGLFGAIHMWKRHLSSNLKVAREWPRKITPRGSFLEDGVVSVKVLNYSGFGK